MVTVTHWRTFSESWVTLSCSVLCTTSGPHYLPVLHPGPRICSCNSDTFNSMRRNLDWGRHMSFYKAKRSVKSPGKNSSASTPLKTNARLDLARFRLLFSSVFFSFSELYQKLMVMIFFFLLQIPVAVTVTPSGSVPTSTGLLQPLPPKKIKIPRDKACSVDRRRWKDPAQHLQRTNAAQLSISTHTSLCRGCHPSPPPLSFSD